MKVTGLAITPPASAKDNPKVTPELLASSLAKYSRSNLGIQTILDKIDWNDPDASVDRIFKMVDYGHASIGGLTGGIAIAVDDISMYLAYKLFEIAQLVDGQESSTRYITMKPESLSDVDTIGIPEELKEEWKEVMSEAFGIYEDLYKELDDVASKNPEKVRIPSDVSDKVRDRMLKNYALDRARYFIPLATKTSAAYVMSARVWAETIKLLGSLPLPEAKETADLIREELKKFAPRLIRHSYPDDASTYHAEEEVEYSMKSIIIDGVPTDNLEDEVYCKMEEDFPPFLKDTTSIEDDFTDKVNRYSRVGPSIRRRSVRFAWNNIAIAELRDLNRHRTGNRFTPFAPVGFYLPDVIDHSRYQDFLDRYSSLVQKLAQKGAHYYGYLLGTQVAFEHTTTLDKFIYEVELRTGLGAHFRYAEHLDDAADDLIAQKPELGEFINIGTAEPE
jgi:hypothetical protein